MTTEFREQKVSRSREERRWTGKKWEDMREWQQGDWDRRSLQDSLEHKEEVEAGVLGICYMEQWGT
jgi:hypothetical protein